MIDQNSTIQMVPMEPPTALRALADHVNEAIRKEAEAQQRAGFSHAEAVRRAMILLEPAREEVARMVAAWAATQTPRVIVQAGEASDAG